MDVLNDAVHTSIHTTFTAFAQRPRKLCGRRELAPKMSETGGFIEIRPGQRSRRRTARMLYYSTLALIHALRGQCEACSPCNALCDPLDGFR